MARLLLVSNAKRDGMGYLEHAQEELRDFFAGEVERVLFVPYAAITKSYETYVEDITPVFRDVLGCEIVSAHRLDDPAAAVAEVDAVVIGGGNTWMLHRKMRQLGLIDAIRERALAGTPYMGWSAGSNMACRTIKSSNDMVITDPLDFEGLALVPFQINPHYIHGNPPGFHGETREQRIHEFCEVNSDVYVAGLPEGMMFRVESDTIDVRGIDAPLRVFKAGEEDRELTKADDISFLLDPAQRVEIGVDGPA